MMMAVTPTKTPPKRPVRGVYDRYPSGSPMWHELDRIWEDALIEGLEELRAERERSAALAVVGDAGGGP